MPPWAVKAERGGGGGREAGTPRPTGEGLLRPLGSIDRGLVKDERRATGHGPAPPPPIAAAVAAATEATARERLVVPERGSASSGAPLSSATGSLRLLWGCGAGALPSTGGRCSLPSLCRTPQALHRDFGPSGPFRHSGVFTVRQ